MPSALNSNWFGKQRAMLKQRFKADINHDFASDAFEWFSGRAGHMERWQYLDPKDKNDPVRGSELWAAWEKAAGKDNMLQRQGRIIAEQVGEMTKLTKPRHTLIDLGPGSRHAVVKNTIPFIEAYGEELGRFISVDVSAFVAEDIKDFVQELYPNKTCLAANDDFLKEGLSLDHSGKCAAVFMGGTIGNIEAPQNAENSISLMAGRIRRLKHNLPAGTIMFIGLEATQDADLLYGDYDHPAHAELEINVMHGIKRDVLPDEDGFDPDGWKYAMKWWPAAHQFCHLAEVTKPQKFLMFGQSFEFAVGQQLVIDNSFKFPVLAMQRAAQIAGCNYLHPYADSDGRMVVHALAL